MRIMADLLGEANPEKQAEFLHNIQVSLNKMEWLVGALLKMAKLDAHAVDFIKRDIRASELLEAAMPSVAILLDIDNQRVELNHDRVINLSIRKVFPVLYSVPWATLVLGTAALFATVMLITYLEMNKLKEKSLIDEIRMDVM